MGPERAEAHISQCADGGNDETTNQSWRVVAVPFKLRSDKEKHHWEDLRPSTSSLAWLAWLGLSETELEPSEPVCLTLLFQQLMLHPCKSCQFTVWLWQAWCHPQVKIVAWWVGSTKQIVNIPIHLMEGVMVELAVALVVLILPCDLISMGLSGTWPDHHAMAWSYLVTEKLIFINDNDNDMQTSQRFWSFKFRLLEKGHVTDIPEIFL